MCTLIQDIAQKLCFSHQ